MKLMSLKQYMKMSKPALIRKITKTLRAMPKKRLAMVCYNITKSKLPRLKVIKRKALPKDTFEYDGVRFSKRGKALKYTRKKKRKFSKKYLFIICFFILCRMFNYNETVY